MSKRTSELVAKVPAVTLVFWIIKILATTLGETGGDAVSMTLNLGYAVASLIFLGFFAVTLAAQVTSRRYHPFAYWAVVVAVVIVGLEIKIHSEEHLMAESFPQDYPAYRRRVPQLIPGLGRLRRQVA